MLVHYTVCAADDDEDLPLTANCFSMSSKLSAFSALIVPVGVWTDILTRFRLRCLRYTEDMESRVSGYFQSQFCHRCGHFLQMTHWQRIKFRHHFCSPATDATILYLPTYNHHPTHEYIHTCYTYRTTYSRCMKLRTTTSLPAFPTGAKAGRDEHAEH